MPPKMRLSASSWAAAEKLGYERVSPENAQRTWKGMASVPKKEASIVELTAPSVAAFPEYVGKAGVVGCSGSQVGSPTVSGLPSASGLPAASLAPPRPPVRIAVTGRHRPHWHLLPHDVSRAPVRGVVSQP